MNNHYQRKVIGNGLSKGNNVIKYTNDALGFAQRNGTAFSYLSGGGGLQNVWSLSGNFGAGANGLYTTSGKIISYSYYFMP